MAKLFIYFEKKKEGGKGIASLTVSSPTFLAHPLAGLFPFIAHTYENLSFAFCKKIQNEITSFS